MNTKHNAINQSITRGCLAFIGLVFAANSARATFDWKGTSSSVFTAAANWATTVPATNTTQAVRLNTSSAANPATREMIYDATLGTTVFAPTSDRGMVIGNSASTSVTGTNRITGGTLSTVGASSTDILGNGVGGNAYLILDGGNYISCANGLSMGLNVTANGTLTINSGTATITTLAVFNFASTIDLNGGTLAVNNITYPTFNGNNSPNIRWGFNGGTLQARTSTTSFLPLPPSTPVQAANVRNGGAFFDSAGFNIQVDQPLFHSAIGGDSPIDGGLTKNGAGTLTMTGVNTYTGPTRVNAGSLSEPMPLSSSSLTVAAGAGLTLSTTNSLWSIPTANITNASLSFNYGSFPDNNFTQPNISVSSLTLVGNSTINISGQNLTVGNFTLLSYGSKSGGGTFTLGTLPSGAVANLTDDGANVVLHVTTGSAQSLVWSAGDGGFWQTNGALLNWNNGTATYTEYSPSSSDLVIFDDTSSGTVNISGSVKPSSLTVNVSSSSYIFGNTGSIIGSVGITKLGTSTLQINNSNAFTGPVIISGGSGASGGTLFVNNSRALGATNGSVTVSAPANTLEIGISGGAGISVSNKTVTISGTGVGGAFGALRGAATASGSNVWAGPVIIGADSTRIGTEDGGNLTITGPIKDNGSNYVVLLRPGSSGVLTISGAGSSYGPTRTFGDSTSTIKLGGNNALSTNALQLGVSSLDLNGFSQTFGGIGDASGTGTILNNAPGASTVTINTGANNYSSSGNFQDGTGTLALVKSGSGTQTLSGAALSYSGTTTVSGGLLNLATSGVMASSITVQSGATLAGEVTTTGSLTLNANSIFRADPSTPGSFTATTINASASPINISLSSAPSSGADVLILTATGGFSGSSANFQPFGLRGGTFYFTNSNTELHYIAPATSPTIVWKGNSASNPTFWDILTTTNWNNAGNPDRFYTGDNVVFNDTANTFTVAIQGSSVSPSSVLFSNSVNAYTVSGGSISGPLSVSKSGSNTVTFTGANSYSGGTTLNTNSGSLVINTTGGMGNGPATVHSGSTLKLVSGTSGSTTFANTLQGEGTVQLFMSLGGPANTYLTDVGNFNGTIQLANGGNTGDKFNANGVTATNATVEVQSASTLFISQPATFKSVSVSGIGNNEGQGAIRITSGDLNADVILLGNTTFGLENTALGIYGNITGTATAGNTNTLTIGTLSATAGGILAGVISDGANGGKLALNQTVGLLTLTTNNTYSGNTMVSSGTLLLSDSGSIGNSPVISLANSSATLDVNAVNFTLGAAQTLSGNGRVSGNIAANGSIAPGGSNIGTLTFDNDLIVNGNLKFDLKKGFTQSNDLVYVSGVLTNGGSGSLTLNNLGSALTVGDQFTLFNQPLLNGSALTIIPPAGVAFANNLAVDGSITVSSTVATNPTNITASLIGNNLNLSWPTDHRGWTLQTNSVSVAKTNSWFAYPGSAALTNVTININPAQSNVFFRLVYP